MKDFFINATVKLPARYQDSLMGEVEGVEYRLVSSDYLKFRPERILD